MLATCPDCGAHGHLSAFFAEADGKRLAAQLADMEPALGRAVIGYLGLFKPVKTALRMPKAIKLVDELRRLVAAGDVCADERGGVRRMATPAMWAEGIEQMLAQRATLTLPLANHNYLRKVVFGLADSADAAAERRKEAEAKVGKHLRGPSGNAPIAREEKLADALRYIRQQFDYGAYETEADHQAAIADARRKYGEPASG
jgi:hypothetical protein